MPPFHNRTAQNRNSPKCAAGARGSFDSRARSGWKPGSPAPTTPAPGPACGSRRTCGAPARSAGRTREGASVLVFVAPPRNIPATAPSRVRVVRGAEHRGAGLETGVPSPRRHSGGECERGACPPFTKRNDQSGLAEARGSARGSSDSRARSGWKPGSPAPTPPAPGPACGSRRTCGTRREAPGGSGVGPPSSSSWRHRATSRQRPPPGSAWCAVRSTAVPVWRPAFQARGAIRGESVRGGLAPLSQKETTNRDSPKRAAAREGVPIAARSAGRFPEGAPTPITIDDQGSTEPVAPSGNRLVVGTAGFEPTTTCTPSKCATRLRHVPTGRAEF